MFVSAILFLGVAVFAAASPEKRSTSSKGGYALESLDCPAGTSHCQSHWCCPDSLTCSTTNATTPDNVCCVGGDDCFNALLASPVCADSSWGLYLATITAPFNTDPDVATFGEFCCLPGQIGTINGTCVSGSMSLPLEDTASSLVPGIAPKSTSSGAATTATTKATTTSSSTTTTTGSITKSQGSRAISVSLSLFTYAAFAVVFAAIFA